MYCDNVQYVLVMWILYLLDVLDVQSILPGKYLEGHTKSVLLIRGTISTR